jgi:hypothetical protein
MYVRAADVGPQVAVDLEAGGKVVSTQTAQISPQQGGALSIGVLSDDTAPRTILRSLKFGDTSLSVAQFDDATPLDPQPQALENFDLIVLTNYASDALTGAQRQALRAWVQGGGTLLVAGGPDAQKTMAHLGPDLQAATVRSTIVAHTVPEVARIAGDPAATSGPVELSVATPRPGAAVLAAHNGVPLAVDLPLGRGHLVYSALEPTLAPFNTWPLGAQGDFWSHLLAPALAGPRDALVQDAAQGFAQTIGPGGPNNPVQSISTDLGNLPSRSLPSLQIYAFLIVLYILVLGPLNFMLLRWRRHLEWSWITVPVVAGLFSIGSFGLAYARNGGDVLVHIDTVVYLDPGAPTKPADSYIGVFAPFHGDYDLSTPGPALAWGLGGDSGAPSSLAGQALGMRIDEGPRFDAHLVGLQMWSMRTLGVRQQLTVPGQVRGQFVLRGNVVGGEVTNKSSLVLHDCVVVGASGVSRPIPVLEPGQTVRVAPFSLSNASNAMSANGLNGSTGPLTNLYSAGPLAATSAAGSRTGLQAAGPSALVSPTRYDTVLGAVFPGGSLATATAPLTLIGWSTAPLGQFSVNGATPHRADLDLIVAPLTLSAAASRFALSPGDLPVSVLGTTVVPSAGGPGNALTLNSGDHMDVQLVVPTAGRHLHLDSLTVQTNLSDGSSSLSPTDAALWNWTTGRWDTIDLSSGSHVVHHAAAYAAPDGRIILRVQAPQAGITFSNVDQSLQIGATGGVQ